MSKVKLYKTDYVLVDRETQKPIESIDVVYHYSSLIEILNDITNIGGHRPFSEYIPVTDLKDEYKSEYLDYAEEVCRVNEAYKIIKEMKKTSK